MFKVGDKVVRTAPSPRGCLGMVTGNEYTVVDTDRTTIRVFGLAGDWHADKFCIAPPTASAIPAEVDPTGRTANTPGAKLDAGKLRPALVLDGFANALEAVVKVGTDGAAKYTDNGWKEVPNGFARYSDADYRHRLKFAQGETHDADSGSLHLAHAAWNALAKLELYLKENAS